MAIRKRICCGSKRESCRLIKKKYITETRGIKKGGEGRKLDTQSYYSLTLKIVRQSREDCALVR